jgi:DMSO/TMAO reductase YedYZ molybdopterin-dependent catalytic subunit
MGLAGKHAVRFPHVCVCANGADPYHMTLWEGVPLREIVWLAKPKGSIRRVRYESFHPAGSAPFQASLPLGQVLETAPGQPPVILAYQMNGRPIPAAKGGPARVIVPGSYGGKLIKWVRRIGLTNDYKSTDSDAEFNNDTESPLKTRARFLHDPVHVAAGQPVVLTGYAQVGISRLARVQYAVSSSGNPWPAGDPDLAAAEWKDAEILAAPRGMKEWPMRYTIAHWAVAIERLAAGGYEAACRTIDGNGIAQPMPRPLPRSGVTAIHRVAFQVGG